MDTGNKKAKKLYHESIENLKNSIYLYKNEVFLILQMEKKIYSTQTWRSARKMKNK